MKRVVVSWSSGKDCAWALHRLRQQPGIEVVGLSTAFDDAFDRVAVHGVRRALVEAQASSLGLPLRSVWLPWPCSNAEYERRMRIAVDAMRSDGVTHIAFGDLFLEEVRAYRERQLAGTGIEPLFPLWGSVTDTMDLTRTMQAAGVEARLTCVDPKQLSPEFAGRSWDAQLLTDLPAGVDPCGENGEFHTFCTAGPMFATPISVQTGATTERDGFLLADLLPGEK